MLTKKVLTLAALMMVLQLTISVTAASFELGEYKEKWSGGNVQKNGEGHVKVPNNYVITGLGLSSYDLNDYKEGNIGPHILKPIVVYGRELFYDGTMGPERKFSNGGKMKIEKTLKLPDGYVMTGWGAGIDKKKSGNWVVDYIEITGRKINTNGQMSNEETFKTGTGGVDTKVKLSEGYVATLIRGTVSRGFIDKASVGGRKLMINGINNPGPGPEPTPTNNAPMINSIGVEGRWEGDLFRIVTDATDADGDQLQISCSQPFGTNCKWQTEYEGIHVGTRGVTVTVSDGKASTTGNIQVNVAPVGSASLSIKEFYPKEKEYVFVCTENDFTATKYDWYYGDGEKNENIDNSDTFHTYTRAGPFTVSCVAKGDNDKSRAVLNINVAEVV
jgi:hypothetical protein